MRSLAAVCCGAVTSDVFGCRSCCPPPLPRVAHLPECVPVLCASNSKHTGPCMLEVRVRPGVRKDLGRPSSSPLQNKDDFQKFLDY